jgi:hypothetical protein
MRVVEWTFFPRKMQYTPWFSFWNCSTKKLFFLKELKNYYFSDAVQLFWWLLKMSHNTLAIFNCFILYIFHFSVYEKLVRCVEGKGRVFPRRNLTFENVRFACMFVLHSYNLVRRDHGSWVFTQDFRWPTMKSKSKRTKAANVSLVNTSWHLAKA